MPEANKLSIAEAHAQISAGKLTAVQLAEACLARVAAREPDVRAWVHIDVDDVLAQARARDAEPRHSALHGIPVGIKDIIDVANLPAEYGSPIYAGNHARTDAACVAALRKAGAIIMGKTVTTEFAMRHPNKTRNPHNLAHTPGGSSSGSAAGVVVFFRSGGAPEPIAHLGEKTRTKRMQAGVGDRTTEAQNRGEIALLFLTRGRITC